jgi:hypothetical protein
MREQTDQDLESEEATGYSRLNRGIWKNLGSYAKKQGK